MPCSSWRSHGPTYCPTTNASLEGLFVALGITAAAMVCDRLARRFQVDLRDTPASLRAIRNAIFIAAFALGCILPTLTDLLTRA